MRSKKKIVKSFIVNIDLWKHDIVFSIDQTDKDLFKVIRKGSVLTGEEEERLKMKSTGVGRAVMLKSGVTVVRLKYYPNTPIGHSVLAHEIYHAVCFIIEKIGIEYCDHSDESYAYTIEYVTKQVYERI